MSVAFVTRDFTSRVPPIPGGCAYYRCYLPMLAVGNYSRMGLPAWDPIRGFGVMESKDMGIFGFKTVMLKLIMDRWTPKQIELAKNLGQKIVVDIDDHYEGLTEANLAYHQTDPERNKISNREILTRVIEAADLVTVSTPYLYEWHKGRHNENVALVRNSVNINQFTPRKQTDRKPVIGWAGSTQYRNGDLELLRDWLPDFLDSYDLKFHHAGHTPGAPSFAEVVGIDPHRVTTSPLCKITDYAAGLKFDIGIVPLTDIPFNHAKSNIKGLEYAAANIPFVASDLPEYRLLHEDGVGLLATTPEEWRSQMETLLDPNYRGKQAKMGRATVISNWSIESMAGDWCGVLTS